MLEALKQKVFATNLALVQHGLVVLTWGNASAYDPVTQYVVIKPSGVDYAVMKWEDMVVVDLDNNVIEGNLKPSSDTPTHTMLYKQWAYQGVHAIIHTHSVHAVAWAQANQPITCYGTTHADLFYGPIVLSRQLSAEEVEIAYEANTGKVILEAFRSVNPLANPGILVANHGPFVWGINCDKALEAAITLEIVAEMTWKTLTINHQAHAVETYIQDKHYNRKHGKHAYYGQK